MLRWSGGSRIISRKQQIGHLVWETHLMEKKYACESIAVPQGIKQTSTVANQQCLDLLQRYSQMTRALNIVHKSTGETCLMQGNETL